MPKLVDLTEIVVICVVLTVCTRMESIHGYEEAREFTYTTPYHCGPRRLGPAWFDRTMASCAVSCLERFPNCYGFLYNRVTRLCTPSSGLSAEQPPPTPDEGDFYFTDSCHSYPDFSIKSNGSTHANVALYYTPPLNYTNARAACQCMNSHLYVANSLDKFLLIYVIKETRHFIYIGLDDIAEEGKFVWADSGQEIDGKLKRQIFKPGTPDNWQDEDCTVIDPKIRTANDAKCSPNLAYICEMPIC